jgi:hypothetical protein
MILLCETSIERTKKASFRDESERGFSYKNRVLSNSSFPSHKNLCNRQDVAPFILHINIYMRETVAKASQDLIPPPFVMRMQQYVKEQLKLISNKKARLSFIQKGFI